MARIVGNVTDASNGGACRERPSSSSTRETGASHEVGGRRHRRVPLFDPAAGHVHDDRQADGFRTFSREQIPVTLNNVTRVDAGMQVGQLTETVTVAAETPLLQTDRAEVRSELKARELVNLPVSLEPQLPVPVPRAARLHAAGGGALGAVEPVARAGVQRQRRQPQLEQHPDRRRQHDQHLAAARGGLRAGARIARDRQRRDQQLRRRAGAGRRIRDQRADQERHQQSPRLGCSSTTRTRTCGRRTTSRRPAPTKGNCALQPVRRHAGRADRAEQALLTSPATRGRATSRR